MDRSVRYDEEIEAHLHVPVLGYRSGQSGGHQAAGPLGRAGSHVSKRENKKEAKKVELVRIEAEVAEGGLAIHEADGSLFHVAPPDMARSLRFLLSRLPQYAEVGSRQTLAITSALEGEGVTTVARSLAAIMAHDLERRVCLLETNWWVPPSKNGADARAGAGLAEVVKGSCTFRRGAGAHHRPPLGGVDLRDSYPLPPARRSSRAARSATCCRCSRRASTPSSSTYRRSSWRAKRPPSRVTPTRPASSSGRASPPSGR